MVSEHYGSFASKKGPRITKESIFRYVYGVLHDPIYREKFDTYRFADHKEKLIDLLARVTTVSVKTVEITRQMLDAKR